MRIAYLMQYTENNYDEITENIDQLIDAGDDVYIILNSPDLRDDMTLAYCDEPALHIVHEQDGALPADLSMPRGFIVEMRNALEYEEEDEIKYDYFITLTDGMLPIVKKAELEEYLNQHSTKDIYYITGNSQEDEEVARRFEDYAFFTNAYDFQKSKMIRGMNKLTANVIHNFKQRTTDDTLYLSYPWFILTHDSAQALVDNFGYCAETFKMCLYPEELCLATMLQKFSTVEHVNENVWLSGETGKYEFKKPVSNITQELLDQNKTALFASKIHSSDNLYIYQNYFDKYREDIPVEDDDFINED